MEQRARYFSSPIFIFLFSLLRCRYLKGYIHINRSLQHSSFDEEVMIHWNAPPLHAANLFIASSLNDYFSHTKGRQWLFFFKK